MMMSRLKHYVGRLVHIPNYDTVALANRTHYQLLSDEH